MFKWGLIGAGNIAGNFANAIKVVEDSEIVGVASSGLKSATEFCHKFGIENPYSSADDLLMNGEIDGIYICTPHPLHYNYIIKSLESKKHVLCEKPMTMTAKETQTAIETAKENSKYLLETMWTHYLPAYVKAKEIVDSGIIGEVIELQGNFGFLQDFDNESRLFNKSLGGGAAYDVGVYPIAAILDFAATYPKSIMNQASICQSGVDSRITMLLDFGKIKASGSCGFEVETKNDLIISGTKGRVIVEDFWMAKKVYLEVDEKSELICDIPFEASGHEYIVRSFIQDVKSGKLESDIYTHEKSINTARVVDEILKQAGIK